MADDPNGAGDVARNAQNAQNAQNADANPTPPPALHVLAQYLKDMSFENPNAPRSLQPSDERPQISVDVDVNALKVETEEPIPTFEVALRLTVNAKVEDRVLYVNEIVYAGLFRLENLPDEAIRPTLLIECPRMMFPFARQIIREATSAGGFMPLMLQPFDFAAIYRDRLAQAERDAAAAQTKDDEAGGGDDSPTETPKDAS